MPRPCCLVICFNPRTRVGCDVVLRRVKQWLSFQSTHPCGVRRELGVTGSSNNEVSIHAPVWGATLGVRLALLLGLFQSTHPCGVRRLAVTTINQYKVSIHAPVWGATIRQPLTDMENAVSIHAPVWGATRVKLLGAMQWTCFNPRTRVGCDAKANGGFERLEFQSTHPCGVRRFISSNRG